jgi:hypothetical protein
MPAPPANTVAVAKASSLIFTLSPRIKGWNSVKPSRRFGRHDFCVANLRQRSYESDTLLLQRGQVIRAHSVETY